jgi:MurNAc alpha-1-phosphate uridylyltransferase
MTVDVAMILAAGRGTRLAPLTDRIPKPLLEVGGRPLIEHHLARLADAGIRRVVINLHHLGAAIRERLGDGGRFGVEIAWSEETELLETAGGIRQALPLLGNGDFLVVNGDVLTDAPLDGLLAGTGDALAHLVMVPSPPWRTHGDFDLAPLAPGRERARLVAGERRLTYAGLGVYDPALVADAPPGPLPLRPLFDRAIEAGRLTGELHEGVWDDIGTPERLAAARARFGG